MKKIYLCGALVTILTATIIAGTQGARTSTPAQATPKSIVLRETERTRKYVEICTPAATFTPAPTAEQTPAPTAGPVATIEPTEVPTAVPTEAPTAEPEHTPTRLYFLATAYSSDPAENGGFGAVDCLYGKPLPADAIAADLSVLPYGTRVYIDGVGERTVVDTAGKDTLENMRGWAASKHCEGWIDLYVGDDKPFMHDWGVRVVTLTILEWGAGK